MLTLTGLEAPLDEPGEDEAGYVLEVGKLRFTMESEQDRLRTREQVSRAYFGV